MDGNHQQQQQQQPAAATAGYQHQQQQQGAAYNHLVQQQQQQLQCFWSYQRQEMESGQDFKNHSLPLARIKKIMKADEDVRMISAEAPILFAKACELFILELTIRSWLHAEENKRRTLQKNDIAAAITRTDIFDFLVDIVPRDDIKDDAMLPSAAPAPASGVPYFYPPMGQPGLIIGRPAPPPPPPVAVDPSAIYGHGHGPSTAWQSVWQTGDDASYPHPHPQGNLDAHSIWKKDGGYGNEYLCKSPMVMDSSTSKNDSPNQQLQGSNTQLQTDPLAKKERG